MCDGCTSKSGDMDSRSADQIFESELASKWPWTNGRREQQKKIQEELECRKKQLLDLWRAVKAESLSDLQEILCCMVLSECVYKRPAAEVIRAVNKFKADFGGQLVSLEHVQPSSDHVLHRYLLAEAGDTLFASFIGTKQYKDVMADANIFQGAIFHEDAMADLNGIEAAEPNSQMNNGENASISMETKPKQTKFIPKPAAHRNLNVEASRFRDELWKGIRDLSKKIDLVVLVHNLSHRVPRYGSSASRSPALSVLLDEAKSLGVPWVLAITNKFSVSAQQQKESINTVVRAYKASPSTTAVINSCQYVMPSAVGTSLSWNAVNSDDTDGKSGNEKLIFAPLNLVRRPFQRKPAVLPVEGVTALCQIVRQVLQTKEEEDFQELARDRIFLEFVRELGVSGAADRDALAKSNSLSAAAVGASVGAGVGIVLAVVMGAASALRKP